ncbi:MAG: sulfurtransferase complex subunit TusD [Gammaproteobacteria bacterium]|uniref:sulfurtransferase complex subunit TusD n=1 Tax=Pseudomaricurvus alcaniphilus TaxID=1166482 RepID=UPI00140C5721|nr:sulfurtransferase complex subunit TusD [Pseudomaricurvus alcaniphilus]MBR9912333.1 sulfurtransferase complex subunit TusD [Gammaproteobacteria bacterium]NHN35846.1 sulfurtransferase complex subunit TusD [Pseudomaricurvus alcaniphilus]
MIFSLLVCTTPLSPEDNHAVKFARTLLQQGHQLYRVFFYADGVYSAASKPANPGAARQGELWQLLAREYPTDLVVCTTAASQRGLVAADSDPSADCSSRLLPCFELAGLAELTDAAASSDRVVTFA